MDQCRDCRFWLNWDSEMTNLGECHRFPPRLAVVTRTDAEGDTAATVRPEDGGWPLTAPDDWCGEFQRTPARVSESRPASSPRGVDLDQGGI
jgi:hypothetical protein